MSVYAATLLITLLVTVPVLPSACALPHTLYKGFAEPLVSYGLSSRNLTFATTSDTKSMAVSVSDYAVYHYAYVSTDGQAWQQVALSGDALGGLWLNGSTAAQLSLTAGNFSLSQQRLSTGRNFMVAYTCSRSANAWDCHDGWQIWQFNATLAMQEATVDIRAVTASSHDGHLPEWTLDGDFSEESRWSAEGDGEWIMYELSETASVGEIGIAFYDNNRDNYFSVQASLDGASWTTVLDHASGSLLTVQEFTFPAVSARFVRIVGHGNNGPNPGWNSYVEVTIEDFKTDITCAPYCAGKECGPDGCGGNCPPGCSGADTCSPAGQCVAPSAYCGDTSCNNGETCSSCSQDCGSCSSDWMNVGVCDSSTDSVIVWSENWEGASIADPWAYMMWGWWNSEHNSVENGNGGKVLQVEFPEGTVGSGSGFGIEIPFDSAYKDLYLSWDYHVPPDFDYGGGGKFFGALGGGCEPTIPHQDHVNSGGWCSTLIWVEGTYRTYDYFDTSDWSWDAGWNDGVGGYWPLGDYIGHIANGAWHRLAIRVKMNTPGQSNGIYEVFDNNVLIYQETDVKFAPDSFPENLIDYISLVSFFGGSDPSPKDQYMQFDNLVAFYYDTDSPYYRTGASEPGRTISAPSAISYHPTPPSVFKETTYTDASGTILSHCGYCRPSAYTDGYQTSVIQVNGASHLSLNVNRFDYDGGVMYEGYKQILKIYQGTGSSKILKRTFENGVYDSVPTSISIAGNSATIEWQAGTTFDSVGFEIEYTSDGTGAGDNFMCSANYVASADLGTLKTCG